jgi:transposase
VYAQLRELTKAHRQVVGDVTRVQSRIKAMLRARGVPAVGPRVYSTQGRVAAIEALPSHGRGAVELLYAAYDALVPIRHAAQRAVVQELHRHAISRVLETCPGFGPIRVAELIATMVTPKRFRTRQQFWLRLWWKAV